MAIIGIQTGNSNTEDAQEKGIYPLFDRSQVIKRSNKYLFDGEYVIVAGEGNFKPKYYNGKFDLHQRAYCIKSTDTTKLSNKYLYYLILKNYQIFNNYSVGSTVPSLRLSSFNWINKISFPAFEEQQKIIDIIAPKEELFLKFSNTIRVDNFEHTKNDLKNLIDIIEPLETISTKIKTTKKAIISLLKMIANHKIEKTNELLINHLTFEKGKNGPKEFESSGTPFLDIRTLNTRISSKFVKDQPNTFKGDILLSLDATVGLVDWFIEGFNGYLYNLKSDYLTKVEILLNVLNNTNKKIIEMNATGSTIKHASKAKKEMLYFKLNSEWKNITNTLFKLLLLIEEIEAKKTKLYQLCVNLLIR
ncbi:restriction endonuclease subunit S [Mesoplasma whartonense]|uniref:restriction endonuclease subunit S n=1 Tax=Mesoplasma whartonense TaxID=2878854 RepID=UPI002022A041|nr:MULTISPECIES: restriction endonuclease subunit S [unclassified Mesoplasma]MCL8211414.1 hypothetical protein [Mesoplasma sp. JKS002664]MCL8214751.1 hypothetical protein [Mesoplasma sp. JKS002663]